MEPKAQTRGWRPRKEMGFWGMGPVGAW